MSIELTHKCPLNCVYCSSNASIHNNNTINYEKIVDTIKTVKEIFKINTVSLSGGEALLYPYFSHLYQFLKKMNFNILIYTSGVLLNSDNTMIPISRSKLKELKISNSNPKFILNINGYNKDSIERMNQRKNSFEIIENTIKNLSIEEMFFGAHIVPFKLNFKYLEKIVNFCISNNFNEINFLRFVPQGRGVNKNLYNTRIEFLEIIKTISKILMKYQKDSKNDILFRLGHPINFLFLLNNENLYKRERFHFCRAGLDAPLVLPNGDVIICPAWKDIKEFNLGNIYTQSFEEIWNSPIINKLRKFITKEYDQLQEPCKSCDYLESCRGKCIAQKILEQKRNGVILPLEKLLLHAPDPQCFKQYMDGKHNDLK